MTPEEEAWLAGWKSASVELPKIREAELAALTDEVVFRNLGIGISENPYENGLVKLQGWLMRLHLSGSKEQQQATNQVDSASAHS